MMKYRLFKNVVLLIGIPDKKLKKRDVATVVEHYPSIDFVDGYYVGGLQCSRSFLRGGYRF